VWGRNVEIPRGEIVKQHARRALIPFAIVALCVVFLDQLFKLWIRSTLPLGGRIEIWPGWVHLSHSQNSGAAWGMMSGQRWLLILVSVGVSVFIVKMANELAPRGVLSTSALGLIFGGAIGNLIDRICFGAVTDMIDLDTPVEILRTFPVFNIADSALTVGVILLMIDFLLRRETDSTKSRIQNPESHNATDSL
jgi:signal peptidase II